MGSAADERVVSAGGLGVVRRGAYAWSTSISTSTGELVGLIGPETAPADDLRRRHHRVVEHRGNDRPDWCRHHQSEPARARETRTRSATWQAIELFDDLTVRENLTVAQPPSLLSALKEISPTAPDRSDAVEEAARDVRTLKSRRVDPERAHAGPAQSSLRRPRARRTPQAVVPRRTGRRSRRPGIDRVRQHLRRSSTAVRRSSYHHDMGPYWESATAASCWSSARWIGPVRQATCAPTRR